MQLGLEPLFDFLNNIDGDSAVLATLVQTTGSSYRKTGAMMVVDERGNTSGLISGGCLEDDLAQHAIALLKNRGTKTVRYDLSHDESAALWGLGLGCGGEICVFLEYIEASTGFGGLSELHGYWINGRFCFLQKIIEADLRSRIGCYTISEKSSQLPLAIDPPQFSQAMRQPHEHEMVLTIPVSPQRRLLICGAGPDAVPLAQIASQQLWNVWVVDHRPSMLDQKGLDCANQKICTRSEVFAIDDSMSFDAAVIMTHNVNHDIDYLKTLAAQKLPYLGLLGPHARKTLVCQRANIDDVSVIHGPAGLDLGAVLPQEIALSIFAQIQAIINDKTARHLSSV